MADGDYPWSRQWVRQMTSTPGEFRRALAQAFGEAARACDDGVDLVADGVSLRFSITNGNSLRIGALQLDTIQVKISVLAGDLLAAERLLGRVDRATQRGGG